MDVSEDNFIWQVGLQIRRLREERELTQEELANDCNVPKSQIGRIERAEINTTLRTIYKIAQVLDIEPAELLKRPYP